MATPRAGIPRLAHLLYHQMDRHKAITVGRSRARNTIIMHTIMEEILGKVGLVSYMQGVLEIHTLVEEEPHLIHS